MRKVFIGGVLCFFASCGQETATTEQTTTKTEEKLHLVHDINPSNEDGSVNAVIEIPTGTSEKWEINKESGQAEWQEEDGKPRIVNYLSYPGNYGMIPQTYLSKESGGDGDPLDILVIGPSVERESILSCEVIGVLLLRDRGEQDDKLIAIGENAPIQDVHSITELDSNYAGISTIIETWFSNYKGVGKMESLGWGSKDTALYILDQAKIEYQISKH